MPIREQLTEVISSYDRGALDETRLLLASLRPPELATLLESTPPKTRLVLWQLLDEETEHTVLQHLHDDVLQDLLGTMDTRQIVAAADDLDTDDFADILQQLPQTISDSVLASLDASDRARVEAVLSHPEDTAGGLMNTDTVTVRPRHAVEIVLRYLRLRKDLPATTDSLIVVNSRDEYVGMLPIAKLVTSDPSVTVREIMDSDAESFKVETPDTEVARQFSEQDLISAPVIDDDGKLLGRITIDDVVDVIIEDAEEALMTRAGLDLDEDTFAPIGRAARGRAVWLTINLMTAFIASAVINVFEDTIAKVVALAILMPIVASMGGIAGTQTLTLVIRALALGQLSRANLGYLINRELLVAMLNGLLLASLVSVVAAVAFDDLVLGAVIALALVINMVVAAVSGALLPSILNKMGIDPAIAGGVVLTTITDVTGFFVFLGLATWAYA